MMIPMFLEFRFLDLVDIVLVAFLLFELYYILRGTIALNIVIGLVVVYFTWLLVKVLNMELLSSIIGQFIGVGFLALIVVFQPEIRRFLLLLGTNARIREIFSFSFLKDLEEKDENGVMNNYFRQIISACRTMRRTNTGALMVFKRHSDLSKYTATGQVLNAELSDRLLQTIFFKNSPLHDGATIIEGTHIKAAQCILPLTNKAMNKDKGFRHRAAVGISEVTDALVIVISEETGQITYTIGGELHSNINDSELFNALQKHLEL
ncbi:MAG: diadenylate cyclase CdaA [Bacteroidales bacterium]